MRIDRFLSSHSHKRVFVLSAFVLKLTYKLRNCCQSPTPVDKVSASRRKRCSCFALILCELESYSIVNLFALNHPVFEKVRELEWLFV